MIVENDSIAASSARPAGDVDRVAERLQQARRVFGCGDAAGSVGAIEARATVRIAMRNGPGSASSSAYGRAGGGAV
jgi:hypothetical protein